MIKKIKQDIKERLHVKRYNHTIRVYETAFKLAMIHGENIMKASIAALLHDYAKGLDNSTIRQLLMIENIEIDEALEENINLAHGTASAIFAEMVYHIKDEDILNAIKYHTYGRPNMSRLEKIIYLSDYFEPERNFEGVDFIRETAKKDLDLAMLLALNSTIEYVKSKDKSVHPLSLEAVVYYSKEVAV